MKLKGLSWLKVIQPQIETYHLHDFETKMDDRFLSLGLSLLLTRDGFVRIEYTDEEEAWQGQHFNVKQFSYFIGGHVSKRLYVDFYHLWGDQIYYDLLDPYLGAGRILRVIFIFQPIKRFNVDFTWYQNKFSRRVDGKKEKVYTADTINLFSTYQFNKYFFIRGAVRYNSYQKKLLTDFLASFTLIPGTVLHLGYGQLYDRKIWQNDRWVPGSEGDPFLNMRNSLFFKVSYLWQIK
jgi:hypothetical protein